MACRSRERERNGAQRNCLPVNCQLQSSSSIVVCLRTVPEQGRGPTDTITTADRCLDEIDRIVEVVVWGKLREAIAQGVRFGIDAG